MRKQDVQLADLFQLAIVRQSEGSLSEAEALFRQVLAEDPAQWGALHAIGVIAYQKGDYESAAATLQQVADLAPTEAEPRSHLGLALLATGKVDQAIGAFREAVRLDPLSPESRNQLGVAYTRAGRTEEAIDAFHRALELNPDYPHALNNLGAALKNSGRWEEAVSCFARAAQLRPNYLDAHNNLGVTLHGLDRVREAIESFQRALHIDSHSTVALVNLGMAYESIDQFEDAIVSYSQALRIQPDCVDALVGLGTFWKEQKRYDEAISCFCRAAELDPKNERARYYLRALTGPTSGGGAMPRAMPPQLVSVLFDGYAERFDKHLLNVLHYQTPWLLRHQIDKAGARAPLDTLDLGCGTGMFGVELRPLAGMLVGVDLSSRMIEKARQRGIYDELRIGEIVAVTQASTARYDLITAADVFIYIGDLGPIFAASRRALRPGGWFAFSTETMQGEGYELARNARYRHSPAYIGGLAITHGFSIEAFEQVTLRYEESRPVEGDLYVLRAAPGQG